MAAAVAWVQSWAWEHPQSEAKKKKQKNPICQYHKRQRLWNCSRLIEVRET